MPKGIYKRTKNRPKYLIQLFICITKGFYWRLKGANSKILAHSENYTRKEMCKRTAKMLAKDLHCEMQEIDLKNDYEL